MKSVLVVLAVLLAVSSAFATPVGRVEGEYCGDVPVIQMDSRDVKFHGNGAYKIKNDFLSAFARKVDEAGLGTISTSGRGFSSATSAIRRVQNSGYYDVPSRQRTIPGQFEGPEYIVQMSVEAGTNDRQQPTYVPVVSKNILLSKKRISYKKAVSVKSSKRWIAEAEVSIEGRFISLESGLEIPFSGIGRASSDEKRKFLDRLIPQTSKPSPAQKQALLKVAAERAISDAFCNIAWPTRLGKKAEREVIEEDFEMTYEEREEKPARPKPSCTGWANIFPETGDGFRIDFEGVIEVDDIIAYKKDNDIIARYHIVSISGRNAVVETMFSPSNTWRPTSEEFEIGPSR